MVVEDLVSCRFSIVPCSFRDIINMFRILTLLFKIVCAFCSLDDSFVIKRVGRLCGKTASLRLSFKENRCQDGVLSSMRSRKKCQRLLVRDSLERLSIVNMVRSAVRGFYTHSDNVFSFVWPLLFRSRQNLNLRSKKLSESVYFYFLRFHQFPKTILIPEIVAKHPLTATGVMSAKIE